mmetsp:Transcript_15132/g.17002  ORF Transcript_15132/g.17002 Transcript_15132/m.17002 type:complete len:114 (-) Transcript_15132:29-370(-)
MTVNEVAIVVVVDMMIGPLARTIISVEGAQDDDNGAYPCLKTQKKNESIVDNGIGSQNSNAGSSSSIEVAVVVRGREVVAVVGSGTRMTRGDLFYSVMIIIKFLILLLANDYH